MFRLFMTRYSQPFIVWFAITLHILWAANVYILPSSGLATAPYAVMELFGSAAPYVLCVSSMLAFVGMTIPSRLVSVLLMLGQQMLLFISALSAIKAVAIGQFPDGVERARLFILNDQGPAIILAILYTVAIVQIARTKE